MEIRTKYVSEKTLPHPITGHSTEKKNRVYFYHLEGESVNFCYVKQESFKTRRPVF